jgi:predicted metal-dependent enzyme (double-stranded beta helix superfamily)
VSAEEGQAMSVATYTLAQYVEDLRHISRDTGDPRAIVDRVRPLAQRLALDRSWLEPRFYEGDPEQSFGLFLLHEEPDHQLAVFAVAWLPGGGSGPHNHLTWSVVAGVDGVETNTFWRRLDDGSRPGYAEIQRTGEKRFGPGDVLAMMPDAIHSVVNPTDAVTVSLHTYGMHLNYTGRSEFDPEKNTVGPIQRKVRRAD